MRFPLARGQPAEVLDGFGASLPPFKANLEKDLPNANLGFVGAHRMEGTNDLSAGLAENEVARSFCPPYGWAGFDGDSICGIFAWFALAWRKLLL